MLRKTLMALSLGLAAAGAQAKVELNELTGESLDNFKKDFLFSMTEGDPRRQMDVKHVRQLSDSDNYYVKVVENGSMYTMLYIKEINSIVIKASGEMFDLEGEIYVSKDYESSYVKPMLDQIKEEDFIVFNSEKDDTDEIIVFTDPSCGYCKKLHSEMEQYLEEGITVKYLPYPRGGERNEAAFNALVSAYCSVDRKAALHQVKSSTTPLVLPETVTGEELAKCKDIVNHYYDFGSSLGVSGTPAIFDKNGKQVGGYVPAQNLKVLLKD